MDKHKDQERCRKIRESNKEFAKRMTILDTWSDYWTTYTTRDGEAYPQHEAREIMKTKKKITCPMPSCGKAFTSIGGLKYHYARCNITKAYDCKKCDPQIQVSTRGEMLRHMLLTHMEELPVLNEEQKEIAQAYIRCESRGEKRKTDKRSMSSSDVEQPLAGLRVVKAFDQLLFDIELNTNDLFNDWISLKNDWQLIELPHKLKFCPPELHSVRYRSNNSEKWDRIPFGASKIVSKDSRNYVSSLVFFTGGINTSACWLPKPKKEFYNFNETCPDVVAISVDCCPMKASHTYKQSHPSVGLIQFWTLDNSACKDQDMFSSSIPVPKLRFMIGHEYGRVYETSWCPCGNSWQQILDYGTDDSKVARMGLLALACNDGFIRIISVPHLQYIPNLSGLMDMNCSNGSEVFASTPLFKVKPVAVLSAPGVGPSTDYQPTICKCLCWNVTNPRLLAAGYGNGRVTIYDISQTSSIIHVIDELGTHIYNPIKSWIAHGAAVNGVAFSRAGSSYVIASASIDRQVKIWNIDDLNCCVTADRAPLTKIIWDYRARGIVTATDSAFTSFNNRVSYRYPILDGHQGLTVSVHRATVWGLDNSLVTNAIATSDAAGEVFVTPALIYRSNHKRDRTNLNANSLFTMIPTALSDEEKSKQADASHQPLTSAKTTAHINDDRGDDDALLIDNSAVVVVDDSLSILTNSTHQHQQQQDSEPGSLIIHQAETDSDDGCLDIDADFSGAERQIMNKPTKFLLPVEHKPITSYQDFDKQFGIEFVNYNSDTSCVRAADLKELYCDRICDYPLASINCVSWSPNIATYSQLLSASQIGLCRIDKVEIIEQVYHGFVKSMFAQTNTTNI